MPPFIPAKRAAKETLLGLVPLGTGALRLAPSFLLKYFRPSGVNHQFYFVFFTHLLHNSSVPRLQSSSHKDLPIGDSAVSFTSRAVLLSLRNFTATDSSDAEASPI